MRTERFRGILLSTLLVTSLMVSAITLLSVSQASAQNSNSENIIVQGDVNARNISTEGTPPPWKVYQEEDNPPIMAAKDIDDGRVVAAGFARMTNGGENYPKLNWVLGELDVLFDAAFRWMKPDNAAPIKVLWYGKAGENYMVYNDALKASYLIDNLKAKGYEIDNKGDKPITSGLLAPYDILVIPGLQLGDFDTGGNPDNLPDPDVSAIDSFVRGGGGLFIMDSGDWDGANFYKVQNKILKKLDFGMYFQMDTVVDPDSLDPTYVREGMGAVFEADVNTDVLFGENYGETKIQVYKVPSLAPEPENYGVFVKISPSYLEGLEEGTLEYTVEVTNVGKITDNYILENSDTLDWELEISPTHVLELENNSEPKYVTLRVKIPTDTPIGTEDVVTITATSDDNENATHSAQCVAIVGNRVRPTIADAQVVEVEPDRNFGGKGWMYVGSSATGLFKNEEAYLKFNLKALGAASAENEVRLYLYCFAMMGAPDKTVWLYRVDENWWEDNINYANKPPLGENLGTATVSDDDLWYSWNVTDYVHGQRDNVKADNFASFALFCEIGSGSANYPENWSYGFNTKEYLRELLKHPYLAVGRSVRTTTARTVDRELDYEEGLPGGTISYNVLVQNTGALDDTYTLTVIDNMGWGPKFLATGDNTMPLTLLAGEFDNATVTVTIPTDAPIGENIDNITVIATSDNDLTISDNDWFVVSVSTKIRPPEDDSTAIQGMDGGNWVWGTDEKIYVGRDYGASERGFLKFDLKAIPNLENIKKARLWLNAEDVDDVGAVVRVHKVDNDNWVERGAGRLMWENQGSQPSIGEVLDVRGVVEVDNYFWDVTDFVRDQFENDDNKLASFALVDLGENIPPDLHSARFTSKESKIRENHPYLEILTTAPERGVRAYISPVFQGGKFGTTLTYTVTVTNPGTVADSYDLENSDILGWELTISPSTLSLAAGESDNATLSITNIPSGRICDLDRITVTATSQGDPTVSDSAIAFAHRSKATIGLENLYNISIDLNIRLREDADNLVAKFYNLEDDNEGEGVVWENIMPWHLIEPEAEVPHPWGQVAVKKVRLVLVHEDTEWLVGSFTLDRNALFGRIMGIKGEWPLPGSDRNALFQEIMDIKGLWPHVD